MNISYADVSPIVTQSGKTAAKEMPGVILAVASLKRSWLWAVSHGEGVVGEWVEDYDIPVRAPRRNTGFEGDPREIRN